MIVEKIVLGADRDRQTTKRPVATIEIGAFFGLFEEMGCKRKRNPERGGFSPAQDAKGGLRRAIALSLGGASTQLALGAQIEIRLALASDQPA